jgi:putative membrane protein
MSARLARIPEHSMTLTEADNLSTAEAIRAAEAKTSAELFCVVAPEVSNYRFVPFGWASALALFVPFPLIQATTWSATTIYIWQLAVFAAVAVGLSKRSIRFSLVPRRTRRARAHELAMRQFRAQGLHQTTQRTGVMIFVALAERHAEIVADARINEKIAPELWQPVIDTITAAVRAGQVTAGLGKAIAQAGDLLAAHFPPGAINQDELPNKLVVL